MVVRPFFGELTTVHAGILLMAPLLVSVPELLPRKCSSPWLRGALAVVVLVMPIAFVVMQAREKFVQALGAKWSLEETTVDDYMEYK